MVTTEIPYFRRCCCCLPLRRGILTWGYIKLTLLFIFGFIVMLDTIFGALFHIRKVQPWLIAGASFMYLMLEMVFTNVLIIGAHGKNYKALRVYMYYSLLNITALLGLLIFLMFYFGYHYAFRVPYILIFVCFLVGFLVFNIYMVCLVRSEIIKLQDNKINFEFVNNAANSECTMNTDEYIA